MKSLNELLPYLDVISSSGNLDHKVRSIHFDSREVGRDTVFVAIRGETTDGHKFIQKAIDCGAKIIVCEEAPNLPYRDIGVLVVADTKIALAQLAYAFYNFPTRHMRIVGVTGTNGKTTCTFLLKSLFEELGEKTGVIGTTGIYIDDEILPATHTTPSSLDLAEIFSRMHREGISTVIMEVSSHALVQRRVHGVEFDAALFTNLTHDHLDFHGTMENYAAAKKILFDSLDENSFAIVNHDDPYAEFMLRDTRGKKIFVGRGENNDVRIRDEKYSLNGNNFSLEFVEKFSSGKKILPIESPLLGKFNTENAALCAVAAKILGARDEQIQNGMKDAHGAPGRMHRVMLENGVTAIIDYAHTPDALEKTLRTCREILDTADEKIHNHIICVFGCGGDRDKAKRPVMGKIAAELSDRVIVTNDNPRSEDPQEIIHDILTGIEPEQQVKVTPIQDRASAIKYAVEIANPNDIILIAGKGHETYQIIGEEKLHFSDIDEVRKYSHSAPPENLTV